VAGVEQQLDVPRAVLVQAEEVGAADRRQPPWAGHGWRTNADVPGPVGRSAARRALSSPLIDGQERRQRWTRHPHDAPSGRDAPVRVTGRPIHRMGRCNIQGTWAHDKAALGVLGWIRTVYIAKIALHREDRRESTSPSTNDARSPSSATPWTPGSAPTPVVVGLGERAATAADTSPGHKAYASDRGSVANTPTRRSSARPARR
jgi:hypothetical protein